MCEIIWDFFFFFNLNYLFIYLWLCWVFVSVRGLSPVVASGGHSSSRCAGLSCCGAQAPDAQAQQLWLTGPAAPRHVGSSQTRARTRVPCIGRQTLNHCATREALWDIFKWTGYLILFIRILWLFSYRSCTYFVRFIPKYFILEDGNVNSIVFLISNATSTLLVYRKMIGFYLLIFLSCKIFIITS